MWFTRATKTQEISKMKKMTKQRVFWAASVIAAISVAVPAGASAATKAPEKCRTFNTGRTTCTYSSGSGTDYWFSTNPRTGYSSNGYRWSDDNSSFGSYNYTYGSGKSGTRSYYGSKGGKTCWDPWNGC